MRDEEARESVFANEDPVKPFTVSRAARAATLVTAEPPRAREARSANLEEAGEQRQ
jgi:hypothetical protein